MSGFKLSIVTAIAILALGAGAAFAQTYPPAGGNIVVTPSNPNPGVNSTVSLTVVVTNATGGAAANQACTATITGGTGATVTPSGTTDAQGRLPLTVNTGSTAGTLTIRVTCGTLAATAVLSVGAPPAPPRTGSAGASDGGSSAPLPWILLGAAIVAVAGGSAFALKRR